MVIIPINLPNKGIDHTIIEKTKPINIVKRSLINMIIWWASTCLLPSFAREINTHPIINEKINRPVKLFPPIYAINHEKNPKVIIMIPRSKVSLGFINGFNGSPVLDEIGSPTFLVFFKFYSSIIIYEIIVFNTFFFDYFNYSVLFSLFNNFNNPNSPRFFYFQWILSFSIEAKTN